MYTLFDFVSHVNGIEYMLALVFVAGFAVMWEIMQPRPFLGFAESVAEDIRFFKARGAEANIRLLKNIAMAPVLLAYYAAAVPVLFVHGLGSTVLRGVSAATSSGWSPIEAYFTGRRSGRKSRVKDADNPEGREG